MLPDVKVKITKIQDVTKLPSEVFEKVMKEGKATEGDTTYELVQK